MKGQSVALKTTGGSGIGVVRFDAQPGDACLPNSATTSNNTNPVCSILANEVGSVCSVVGNLLTATAATVCRVTAVKEGDPLYLPVSSDQVFIKFGAGIDRIEFGVAACLALIDDGAQRDGWLRKRHGANQAQAQR